MAPEVPVSPRVWSWQVVVLPREGEELVVVTVCLLIPFRLVSRELGRVERLIVVFEVVLVSEVVHLLVEGQICNVAAVFMEEVSVGHVLLFGAKLREMV